MNEIVNAVYENGVFRPLDPLQINVRDGEQVWLRIEEPTKSTQLDLASKVYEGLSEAEVTAIEKIAFDRTQFFGTENAH